MDETDRAGTSDSPRSVQSPSAAPVTPSAPAATVDPEPPAQTPAADASALEASAAPVAGETAVVGAPQPAGTPEEQDRRLAAELARRGVPSDEIERLLTLPRHDALAAGAAEREAAPAVVEPPYDPHPSITLPDVRESTQQERDAAEKDLRLAHIALRRGQYGEAEKLCRSAVEQVPGDAAALELYGDVVQAVGRVDDALFCYDRAREVSPGRASAERKFAELRLMQNRELDALREEYIPRNPYISVALSAVFPGGGQAYNGEPLKGLLVALAALVLVLVLGWTDLGFQRGVSMTTVFIIALAGALYVYALIDANAGARRGRKPRTGWEV